jgi:phthiocerol/phenolphthiocerol synthesis type-I polyketide synthase E
MVTSTFDPVAADPSCFDSAPSRADVAVIGLAGRFPGAPTLDQFWRNVASGVESITFFDAEELAAAGVSRADLADPRYVPARGVLDRADWFDAAFFEKSATEALVLNPQHRLFLECAWEALEHAGYAPGTVRGAVGIYAGCSSSDHLARLRARADLFDLVGGFFAQIANDPDFLATRVSYELNLQGPSLTVQTACSTSLVAVHVACQSLVNGECDLALAGGVTVSGEQRVGYRYQEQGIYAPDGHCRPFDADAKGTVSGGGIGLVVLKRLTDARADGDTVHAVIRGSAVNNDGSVKVGFTAPSVEGQSRVISEALAVADVPAETIGYVEAHGTGTFIGDPIEVAALTHAFRASTSARRFCALGSVKANVGHLSAAAGVTGLIKAVLALRHATLPPSPYFRRPNPEARFDESPFYVNTEPLPWPPGATPRRAGVSSLGIGGTNAHVVLEEAPPAPASGPSRPWQVLCVSAKTATALDAATGNLLDYLRTTPAADVADVAYTLQMGRAAFSHRRAIVGRNRTELVADASGPAAPTVCVGVVSGSPARPVFMFPGVSAQHVNMAADLYCDDRPFREDVDRCLTMAEDGLGRDVLARMYQARDPVDSGALDRPELTHLSLFVVEYCLAARWIALGVRPAALIGHSLGEYAAATIAGVFTLDQALRVVQARGRLMARLPEGRMLAVPLGEREVERFVGDEVSLASVNGPGSCVLSGTTAAVTAVERRLAEEGIECRRLRFSHAPHSGMMDPMLDAFAACVRAAAPKPPTIPLVSSTTGTWLTAEQAVDPMYWAQHLRRTVRVADGLACALADADAVAIELGPGRSMSALARRVGPRRHPVISTLRAPNDNRSDMLLLAAGLAACWTAGVPVAWDRYYGDERRRRVPLPTYPFERRQFALEPVGASRATARDAVPEPETAPERLVLEQLRLMSEQLDLLAS